MKSEWTKVSLLSVCSRLSSGKSISSKLLEEKSVIPVYGGNGVRGYIEEGENFNGECAIIGRQGAYCGNVRFFSGKAYMTEHAIVAQANACADTRFLAYKLSLMQLGRLSGQSAQPGLSVKVLGEQVIDIPPLPIQRKIATILSALDDKIETNNAICRNLEEQAMAVFKRCFFTPSEQQVEDKPVYDFAEYINGAAFKQHEYGESGLPIIKIAELKSGLSSSTLFYRGEDKDEKYYIQNGDILFSWSGNPETSIDVFIWTRGDAILNQHIFNVKSRYEAKWFTYLMLKNYMPVFAKIASDKQTTGLGHVTVADLKRLTFPFNLGLILTFEKEVSFYMEQVYNAHIENNTLSILRDALLPKLMNGELDVDNVEL